MTNLKAKIETQLRALGYDACEGMPLAYFMLKGERFCPQVLALGQRTSINPNLGDLEAAFIREVITWVAEAAWSGTVVWRRIPAIERDHAYDDAYKASCRLVVVPWKVTTPELAEAYLNDIRLDFPDDYEKLKESIDKFMRGWREREESKENTKDTEKLGDQSEGDGVHAGRPDSGQSE